MALTKYNQKRNFKLTAEPKGRTKTSKSELVFVVQKHAASHLHYDFRLELDGVLKSWAVPKGPSMNPDDKRLAMMVEDHPYTYKDFEGTIPEGNYGAGNVIVWDNGTYHAADATSREDDVKKLRHGLHKGHISFVLKGKKLKGEFSLVKLHGKQENAWLLIKKKDDYSTSDDILKKNKSVITKVSLENLSRKPAQKSSAKKKVIAREKPVTEKRAEFIKPMLAEITENPFDDKDWVFEIKYDGYRAIAVINPGEEVDLFSRNHLSFNTKFKPVAVELKKINHTCVLDGEVVVEDSKGLSGFQLLQNYQRTGAGDLKYYVFDILFLNGEDTQQLSLIERKKLLKMLLTKYRLKNIFYSDHVNEKGKAFFDLAVKNKLEGVMAKDAKSSYHSGQRSSDWLKIKITQEEEAIIVGFTEPKGSRNHFGSLLLARYKGSELKYIGNCGTGFNEVVLKELFEKFKPYYTKVSPLKEKVAGNGKVQWLKPKFVCQVKFTEWTQEGSLRHPVFLGLRMDLPADEVQMENNNKTEPGTKSKKKSENMAGKKKDKASGDFNLKIGKVTLQLTNQHKIYFPADKITKGDLVNYYNQVATLMLPYIKNRPQSMNRFPNGISGPSFYQKDVDPAKIPSWLQTKKIYSKSNKAYVEYLLCNDKATLLYMANLGCIEINPWNSTVKNISNPDWVVIDLDPEKIDFKEVVKTALTVKDVMDELDVECYCKTSGATGLHIYVPLAAKYDYDTAKNFAHVIAYMVNKRLPETTSIERMPVRRQHKVYVDFLQNRRGQTLAAPYSVRPKPGATVSAPLEWKEVNNKLSPAQFTIRNMLSRIEKKGDLWKPVIGKGVNLQRIIKKLPDAGQKD